jgi:plasmid stabilization system protein ParE
MTLQWSPESIHDLLALRAHIAEHDPAAAKRVALHILYCVEYLLSENPTRDTQNALHRSLPPAPLKNRNRPRLPHLPPLARPPLAPRAASHIASTTSGRGATNPLSALNQAPPVVQTLQNS